MYNKNSLDTICGALAYALGVEAPEFAAPPNEDLAAYIDKVFDGEKADRVVMYNPDAIAQWIYEKYPLFCAEVTDRADVKIPLATVMPSVTPVCFSTMYTGAQPSVHTIQKYEKPIVPIDTLFDALIRAGKKPAIISSARCSIGNLFLKKDMDYYLFDNIHEVNACAAKVILEDKYDLIVIYNGNYDATMHRTGPESERALAELRCNSRTFATFYELIKSNWKQHNTLLGFAMDHGCHEIDDGLGSHGLDMEEDINIVHLYKGFRKE